MGGWRKPHCPNSKCNKRFYAVQDALNPGTASTQGFFKFVNHTESGRITKEELADWYTTNFNMTLDDAMEVISGNWQHWDVPKNHPFLKLGWFRSKDQGDLDMDEFPPVQDFMKESLARSLALKTQASPAVQGHQSQQLVVTVPPSGQPPLSRVAKSVPIQRAIASLRVLCAMWPRRS